MMIRRRSAKFLSPRHRDLFRTRAVQDMVRGEGLIQPLHSDWQWRKTRDRFVLECQPRCQMCGQDRDLEVHHALPWALFPEHRYTEANLITLCSECHFRFGHRLNWKCFNPNLYRMVGLVQASYMTFTDFGPYQNDQNFIDRALKSIDSTVIKPRMR